MTTPGTEINSRIATMKIIALMSFLSVLEYQTKPWIEDIAKKFSIWPTKLVILSFAIRAHSFGFLPGCVRQNNECR